MLRPRALVVVLLLLAAGAASAQTPIPTGTVVPLGTPIDANWDYTLANLTAGGVTRWELRVGPSGAWVDTGLPVGATTYKYRMPSALLAVGTYTVSVRACNAATCGPTLDSTIIIGTIVPPAPSNLRFTTPPVVISLEQAAEVAQCITYAARVRRLDAAELTAVATTYAGPLPPTLFAVRLHMQTEFARLAP